MAKRNFKEIIKAREERKVRVQKTNFYDLVKYPVNTEKTSQILAQTDNKINSGGTHTFIVDIKAEKPTIKAAVESIFNVEVASVNVIKVKPKAAKRGKYQGFKAGYKKAYVTLTKDSAPIKTAE